MPTTYSAYLGEWPTCSGSQPLAGKCKNEVYGSAMFAVKRPRPAESELVFQPTNWSKSTSTVFDQPYLMVGELSCVGNPKKVVTAIMSAYDSYGIGRPTVNLQEDPTISHILSKIKNQKVNLAVMAGEYREAARMFVTVGQDILAIARAIARKDWRGLPTRIKKRWNQIARTGKLPYKYKGRLRRGMMASSKFASDRYLMYRFGIEPLVYDMEGIVKQLTHNQVRKDLEKPVHSVTWFKSWNKQSATDRIYANRSQGKLVVFQMQTVRDRVHIQYKNGTSDLLKLASQLGLLNAPHALWELIPFSFLVDRFYNIGLFLESLDALVGIERYAFTRTVRTLTVESWPNGSLGVQKTYNRSVKTLSLQAPKWEPSKSFKGLVDIIALMRQRLAKGA